MSFDPASAVLIEDEPPAYDPSSAMLVSRGRGWTAAAGDEPVEFDPTTAMLFDVEQEIPAAMPNRLPGPRPEIDAAVNAQRQEEADVRRGIFSPDSAPYRVLDDTIAVDPARYDDAAGELWKEGLIDSNDYFRMMNEAQDVKAQWKARRELELAAGENPELKAALYGLTKGALQTGAALSVGGSTGVALAPTGPGAVVAGLAAGTGAGIVTGEIFDTFAEKLAETDQMTASFLAARKLAPGYDSAGQFASILIPSPLAISRLNTATKLIAAERGAGEAAKFVGRVALTGAGIGAGTDAVLQGAAAGIDLAQGNAPTFLPESLAVSATLGALTAGMGVKSRNKLYTAEELTGIEARARQGFASLDEAQDYRLMREAVTTLRNDERLLNADAVRRATVDFMGNRALDVTEIINPRFQQAALADAGFTPPPGQPALSYAAENPQAANPLAGTPAAYSGQAFLNRGGPAPAFQGGSNALPGPEGVQALPAPTVQQSLTVPPAPSNIIPFDPSTATPVDDIPPTASAPAASTLTAPEPTGSPEVIAGEGATVSTPAKPKRSFPRISYDPGTFPVLSALQEPTVSDIGGMPVVEFPVDQIKLSKDVPNFKENADPVTGVVQGERLEGKVDRRGMAPIIAWRRLNGDVEVISGRHRLDLFRRNQVGTIPTQIFNEADGFTQQDALTLDAELNIRDGQGTTKDYASYFRNAGISYDQAAERSLLSRAKGRAGFTIGAMGSEDLYALHQSGRIPDAKAEAIAGTAPGDADLQTVGIKFAKELSASELVNLIKVSQRSRDPAAKQGDLFGNSDANLNNAVALVKASRERIKELDNQILSVKGAVKRPEAARKMGVDVKDPDSIRRKIDQLTTLRDKYERFLDHPDILAEVRALAFGGAAEGKPAVTIETAGETPFNLVSDPVDTAPVADQVDEEAARAAAVRKAGYDSTPSMFDDAGPPAARRSSGRTMADAGPPASATPASPPVAKPSMETYNDAQVFADYPEAVGVFRAVNGVWTMPFILGGLDKVPAIELPEGIEFFRTLSGNNPKIILPRKLGVLGTFLPAGEGYITLHPDLIANGGESSANMIFMHEAGHFIQFMDDFKMEKGNLLGIIAGVRSTKHSMPLNPAEAQGKPISKKQREAIRKRAEENLRVSLEGEVRRVLVEEPVYAQSGVTPEIVKGLFGLDAREQWPELYDWFAKQDGATKKAIVKQAMKGIVDARLEKFQVQGEQIGTTTREETQRVGGREPTQDELREAFHAAMRAEMSARNVADFKYIRQELIDLTKWWKPFDMAKASDKYLNYRFSAAELFADAMSVLLNSPADLKARAPVFYETFWNHLDTRPKVKAKLIDIYDRINKGRDTVLASREARDWENYEKGDKAFLDAFNKATSRRTSLTGLWDDLRDQYWDEYFPLTSAMDKARAEGKLPRAEVDPYRYLTEEHPMADSRLQLRLADLKRVLMGLDEAGIAPFYLDDYLKYTRIANEKYEVQQMVDGEMQTIGYEQSPTKFNPDGETKRTAQNRLDYMRGNLPPEKWAILESSAKDFRDKFHDVVKFYWENGMLTDDLWQKFNTNDNYATFTVLEYVKEYTSSRMVARKGTVRAVARPSVEMAKKMVTMFRAAQRNKFKAVMAPRLMQINPDIARRAPMKFNGKFMAPQEPTEFGWRLITWREKGQLVGSHIQDRWADAIDQHSPAMGDAILKSLNWGFRNTVYNLIIRYNPNFQLFTGPVKDFTRAMVNQPGGAKGRLGLVRALTRDVIDLSKSRDGRRVLMEFTGTSLAGVAGATGGAAVGAVGGVPGMVLGGVVAGNAASYAGFFAGRLFAHAIESLPWLPDDPSASVDWARGDIGRSALMREMIENFAIGGPWAYLGRGTTTSNPDQAIDALMGKYHIGGEPRPLPWILRQIANYFNDVEFAGQILQNIPKTSSYRVNTRSLGMPKRDAAYWVRNHIGLPNTFKKGKHIGNFQALAPFANIFIRSMESMGKLLSGREGKTMSWREYVLAFFLAGGGVVAIMQRLAKEGVLGEDLAKAYAGASEYAISNKGVLALGTVDSPTGPKSAMVTIPIDENNRLLFATVSKLTKVMVRMAQGRPLEVQGFDILRGFTATLPGMNPVVEVGDKWGQFFTGKSPVNHRNQPILSEDEQKAGGLYAVKPMVGWTLNETGVSNFFRYDPRASTYTEAAVGSVPAFNRFLVITDQGSRETMRSVDAGEQRFKAIKRLEMPAQIKALRQEYYWLRSRADARTPQEEGRYQELQAFETFFQNRLDEADTANTLGRQSEVDFAIRSILQESKLYRAR